MRKFTCFREQDYTNKYLLQNIFNNTNTNSIIGFNKK